MKRLLKPNSLYYVEEHIICSSYVSGQAAGFKSYTLTKEKSYQISSGNEWNFIFFFLKGEIEYSIGDSNSIKLAGQNEMIFIPKLTKFKCTVVSEEVIFISHEFEKPLNLCDKFAMQSLSSYCDSSKAKELLTIQKPLRDFLDSLQYYLQVGMLCKHMHEVKQKELFLLMRAFYTKQENAAFFYPIISKNMDFRSMVYDKYAQAKTVQGLASSCNLSLATFNRLFSENFQESPYNWMQKQKARQIAGLLSNKELPLIEIINDFDFSSAAHFTLFCKKYLQMTPSKFRELSKSEIDKRLDTVFKK